MENVDSNIRRQPGRYVAQVSLATTALFLVLWVEHLVAGAEAARALLVGAIASTAFILFVSPHRPAAMPRRVLGGHALAILIAGGVSLLTVKLTGESAATVHPVLFSLEASLTVGGAILAMAATNTEHAPAAGTALAIAAHGFDWQLVVFVATSIGGLAAIHYLVRSRLMDLY